MTNGFAKNVTTPFDGIAYLLERYLLKLRPSLIFSILRSVSTMFYKMSLFIYGL